MNRGAAALQEKLSDRGARAALAQELKIDPGMVSRWVGGQRRPEVEYRAVLEDKYGIGWRLWDEDTDALENADLAEADPEEPAA